MDERENRTADKKENEKQKQRKKKTGLIKQKSKKSEVKEPEKKRKQETKEPQRKKKQNPAEQSKKKNDAKEASKKKTAAKDAAPAKKSRKAPEKKSRKKDIPLKVVPLGGLNEVGKNMTLLECGDEILIIDCGMTFPEDEMLGIDVVIPDFSYVVENAARVKGLIITHGHEDHIGGIPYLLRQINVPVYGTRLTLGLVENKLKEHGIEADFRNINAGDSFKVGMFDIEAIRMTHSVADAVGYYIKTPAGSVFHTGDFKIDYTPVDGDPMNFRKLAEIGSSGLDLLLMDSTNAVRPGYTASERVVGEALETIFRATKTRIIIATFSSNVHRVQKIIDNAVLCGRKVAVSGRSMENVVNLATELGYLNIPAGVLIDINKIKGIPPQELVVITTGSQGEPMSALSRMATNDHKSVQIQKGDTVILSSTPVPGNEKMVSNIVNRLFELGANVIYSDIAEVHASGHAREEELKLMHSILKPKYFLPVHGEYRHLTRHAMIAKDLGMPEENIFILSNGDVFVMNDSGSPTLMKNVVPAEAVLVDGFGIGDVGNIVLRDRKMLSESGLIMVVAAIDSATHELLSGPDIITRGFVYVKENSDLIDEAKAVAYETIMDCIYEGITDRNAMKNALRDELRKFIFKINGRSPIILPVFLDV